MIIDEVYEFLHGIGLVQNHAAYSTEYLGHSERYFDYLRCSGKLPSIRSLVKLSSKLQRLSRDENVPVRACDWAYFLSQQTMDAVLNRCC